MIEEVVKDGKTTFRYSWQPQLDDGTPIGGLQVVEAESKDALSDEIAKSYTHLYRRNRELMREKELTPSASAPAPPKFNPRPLTAAEKLQLARDFADPEKVDSAIDLMLEARLGAKPEAVVSAVNAVDGNAKAIRAAQEAAAWRDAHPNFYPSQKNCQDLATWIQVKGLEFTFANFDKAFEALSPALETAPPSVPETPAKPPETQTPSRIAGADESGTQRQAKVPSPVTRRQASGAGDTKSAGLTIEQIKRMPTEEYKRKLKDPAFARQVDALFSRSR